MRNIVRPNPNKGKLFGFSIAFKNIKGSGTEEFKNCCFLWALSPQSFLKRVTFYPINLPIEYLKNKNWNRRKYHAEAQETWENLWKLQRILEPPVVKCCPRKISTAMSKKSYYLPVRPEGNHPDSQGTFSSLIMRSNV